MTGGFLCPLLYYPRNNAGALSQIKTAGSVPRLWNLPQYPCKTRTNQIRRQVCYITPVTNAPATEKTRAVWDYPSAGATAAENLHKYPRNTPEARKGACKPVPLLCNLPQYPCKNTHKTFSYSCKEGTDQGQILQICYTTPVTNPARNTLGACFLQEMPAEPCHNTPVKIGGVCHNTPVKNRGVCHNTPVKVAQQTFANQTLNFLEIILKRLLESRPADSPAGAGGPCRHNRAYKGRGENKGRIFQNRTAGTVRPAGFWIL
jgi:hypothetical protein